MTVVILILRFVIIILVMKIVNVITIVIVITPYPHSLQRDTVHANTQVLSRGVRGNACTGPGRHDLTTPPAHLPFFLFTQLLPAEPPLSRLH